ncbi:hypothetical protein [Actinoplanes nipponensis]|nr:hypothetical protein [Actinoplanes nipponensis]
MLGLQYLAPGGFLCFVFLEGAVALGILLALAELVSWWGVLVLPVMVAVMVKLNDVVAGSLIHPAPATRPAPDAAAPDAAPGSPGAETVRLSAAVIAQVVRPPTRDGAPALRPAAIRRGATTDAVRSAVRDEDRWSVPGLDASALNGPPVTRQWSEDLDDSRQRARQSGSRRYE